MADLLSHEYSGSDRWNRESSGNPRELKRSSKAKRTRIGGIRGNGVISQFMSDQLALLDQVTVQIGVGSTSGTASSPSGLPIHCCGPLPRRSSALDRAGGFLKPEFTEQGAC